MDISSYFKYAFRLWQFDENAAQELRDKEASSIWMSLGIVVFFGFIIGSMSVIIDLLTVNSDLLSQGGSILFVYIVGSLLGIFVLAPLFFLLIMLWNQMWLKIFGVDKPFTKTVEIFATLYIPSYIISIITSWLLLMSELLAPESAIYVITIAILLISLGVGIFAIFVIVKTFSITHDMDIGQAVLAGFVSTISAVIAVSILFFIIGLLLAIFSVSAGSLMNL